MPPAGPACPEQCPAPCGPSLTDLALVRPCHCTIKHQPRRLTERHHGTSAPARKMLASTWPMARHVDSPDRSACSHRSGTSDPRTQHNIRFIMLTPLLAGDLHAASESGSPQAGTPAGGSPGRVASGMPLGIQEHTLSMICSLGSHAVRGANLCMLLHDMHAQIMQSNGKPGTDAEHPSLQE